MRFLIAAAVALVSLTLPSIAEATRSATDQEITQFRTSVKEIENVTTCAHLLRATTSDGCSWVPRPDYEPTISNALVSTMDETWATAYVAPAPRTTESETVVFRKEQQQVITDGVPETHDVWRMNIAGNGCELGERTFGVSGGTAIHLPPDLALAMGCTPVVAVKVRCLDRTRTFLLALEEPRQCAVAGPESSPFPGWMNIRELHWHQWGDEKKAWALGVIRELPAGLIHKRNSTPVAGPSVGSSVPLAPISVRLVAFGRVSCGTADFYSGLRVTSPFGHFELALPTCPDQFFAPS